MIEKFVAPFFHSCACTLLFLPLNLTPAMAAQQKSVLDATQATRSDPATDAHSLNTDALTYALHVFENQWQKSGDSHFSKDDAGRVWQIKGLTLQAKSAPLAQTDASNKIAWRGSIVYRWDSYRLFYPDKGWTEWVPGHSMTWSVTRQDGDWRTLNAFFPYHEKEPNGNFKRVTFTPLEITDIARLERQPTLDTDASHALLSKFDVELTNSENKQLKILKTVKPERTKEAVEKKIYGKVILSVEFCANGTIGDVRILRGVDGLDEQAIEAARKIQFVPARKNGVPVTVVSRVEFSFQPVQKNYQPIQKN
jgi:TonB family protein